MSPASPSPTTPKPESHFKQSAKALFRGIFKPSSLKPSASTPTLGVYPPGAGDAAAQGAQPRASLNNLTANKQQIVPSPAGATSLRVPEIFPAGVTSVPGATVQITTPVSDESAAVVLTSEESPPSTEEQVSPQPSALKKNVKLAWDGFKVVAKTAEGFLDGTPFKTPIAAFNKVIDTADAIIDNKESVAKQLSSIRERMEIVSRKLQAEDRANLKDIKPTLDRFAGTLENTEKMLKELNEAGFFERLVEHDELPKEIADIARQVDEATKNFQLELNLANFRQIHAVKTDTEVLRLDKLKPIQEVRHTSLQISSCAKGTREDIIKSIISWCKDTSDNIPGIYWLSGMAGTGKSTIAFTVCEQLHGDGRKRSNIMPTIAHDLALGLPRFRRALLDAQVDANPPALKYHLKDLLVDPWDISIDDREGLPPLVVVLDALDELENSDGSLFMEELIKIIAGHHDHLRGLKFLVTSRRDPRIVEIGNSLSKDTVYRLEEVPTTTIEHDINIYLRVSLPQLDPNQLRRLADQSSGLFIYAATAVRFIVPQHASRHPPPNSVQKDRLEILLNSWPGESHRSAEGLLVDHLYEDILTRYILPMAKVDQKIAVAVLHTVLCTEEPIFVSDIPHLWGKNKMAQDTIGYVLEQLHSVLYTSSDRVYSYHKSFVDFMCTPARFANQELAVLCCLTPEAHLTLDTSCFRLMTGLEFNMCSLPSSFLDDFEIKDLPENVEKQISSTLQYACRHWSAHLSRIPGTQTQKIIGELKQWLYTRSLFWMEAMNLLKVIGECYPALLGVRQWLNTNMTTNERASQKDLILDLIAAENLVTIFGSTTISKSTPHLYLSALAATPRDSSLMMMWHHRFPAVPKVVALRNSGSQLLLLKHDMGIKSVCFSPDGVQAITGSDDNTVRIWDLSTGKELHKLEGHEGSVNSVSFSPDGLHAISGSDDNTVRIWDVSTGEQLHKLEGHEDTVNSVSFSPDGLRAISGSDDNTVRIWDVSTGEQLHELEGHEGIVTSVSFSPDGLRAISASDDSTVRIWDVSTREQLHKLEGHERRVNTVSFSPDGLRAISASDDSTVRIWDVSTGEQLHKLEGHEMTVNSVSFSPDGLRAISGSWDTTVCIWDVSTGEQLHKLEGHENTVNSVSFSPDGLRAISGSRDNTVRIWDVSTGEQLHKLEGHNDTVKSVSFSPDGLRAISGSWDNTVRIWDVSTGAQLHKLEGHEDTVNSVSFSPDGLRTISGSWDNTVRIWDVSTGAQLHKLEGHEETVNSVSFSPDGLCAISASYDNTVRIWDVSTGEQLHKLEGHESAVNSVSFSPDGLRAISGSWDKTVRIWNLPHRDTSTAEWHVSSTGWIANSSGQRCMWISPEMRDVLHSPQCLIISPRGSVKVSLGNTSFGPEWGKCYNPQA